jgi:hypothetical protein
VDVVGRRDRRQADADAAAAHRLGHVAHHLQQQAGAVLDRAAVVVGAPVGAALEELVEQVAVGAVHLDAVELRRRARVHRGMAKSRTMPGTSSESSARGSEVSTKLPMPSWIR